MTLLDVAPNLRRILQAMSDETRAEIIGELCAIHDQGRAGAYDQAIKAIDKWREIGRRNVNDAIDEAVRELGVRAKVCRRES